MGNIFRKWIDLVEGILDEYFDFENTCSEILDVARAGNKIYALEEELPNLWKWVENLRLITPNDKRYFSERLHQLKQDILNAY